jgi:hypothetical protein
MDVIKTLITQGSGFYAQNFRLQMLVLFLIIIYLFSHVFDPKYILAIGLAFFVVEFATSVTFDTTLDANQTTLVKLQELQLSTNNFIDYQIRITSGTTKLTQAEIDKIYARNVLDSLYTDADLINFLHSILTLADYNSELFYRLLKGTNNILKLKAQIESYFIADAKYPDNTHEMVQNALKLQDDCMNILSEFIYTVPKQNDLYGYVRDATSRYTTLINRDTSSMIAYSEDYIKTEGINTGTKFLINDYRQTKPYLPPGNYSTGMAKLQNFYA